MEHPRDSITLDLGECGEQKADAVYSVLPGEEAKDDQYTLHAVLWKGFDIKPEIEDEECVISQLQEIQFQIEQMQREAG